uniref:Small ribosomal subunit protein mS25 n=1 Tax=Strigamia maritima TaxID=126957 RepID=T1JMZ4_STRMM
MPFMRGVSPIRRTLKYLESGKIHFKECVKIMTINYNYRGDEHEGARDFIFWYLPQIQYKNPDVQMVTFRNLTPTPFIRCYLDDGREVLMDVFNKSKDEIHDHLNRILGKTEETLREERQAQIKIANPANFGLGCRRHCMCEVTGQIPCPNIVQLPNKYRGKFIFAPDF